MRRGVILVAFGCGAASVLAVGVIVAALAHADSITPDLSGVAAAVTSASGSATASANSATASASSATAAQTSASAAASSASSALSALQSVQNDFAGTFTRAAGLPSASSLDGKRIYVPDLGGGPDQLRAIAGCWVRMGSPLVAKVQTIALATTIPLDGLANSPNIVLSGSSLATKATIVPTNACSMPGLVLSYPTGAFSATGALAIAGVSTNAPAVSVGGIGVTASFGVFALLPDGSNYTRTMGPTLP